MGDLIPIDPDDLIKVINSGYGELGIPYSKPIFLLKIRVAGSYYVANIEEIFKDLTEGQRLDLYREPENPYDQNAIRVEDGLGRKLGYVPRSENKVIARLMDGGKRLYGSVRSKEDLYDNHTVFAYIFLED